MNNIELAKEMYNKFYNGLEEKEQALLYSYEPLVTKALVLNPWQMIQVLDDIVLFNDEKAIKVLIQISQNIVFSTFICA